MKFFIILLLAIIVALSSAECITDAYQTQAYGPGVVGGAPPIWQKNKMQPYHIQAICSNGDKRKTGGDVFIPTFSPSDVSNNVCTDLNDGRYACQFLPLAVGTMSMKITFMGNLLV